ncbi:membrane protein [Streptomyces sp. AcH 505]|uniref:FxsA family membrane protein n=1 Tax=unclassified Streptomyces TaxID=2593676 RepID=UPI00059199F8|nr:FxsA family membrane protein [Streptomyces sp. NBC_00370]KIF70813.1 membrane protein [Streptomyces sp. AcH 505]
MTTATHRTAPRRSRARTLVPLGIAVWLALEIWLLVLVAGAAGGLTVWLLILAEIVVGALVMKRAGRRAFRNLTGTLQRQQRRQQGEDVEPEPVPGRDRNGFLMLGGLLIMVPGLITDVFGLLLLVPALRTRLGDYTERTLERRLRATAAAQPGGLGEAFEQARMRQPDGKVVQGEVIKNDERDQRGGPRDDGPRPPLTG